MTVNNLIEQLKENNQDFEWYSTTESMIKSVLCYLNRDLDYGSTLRVLDIGCGNGSFFEKWDSIVEDNKMFFRFQGINKFGIEKSPILIENLNKDVILLGTDFNEQTLIDKQMDIIFCNPPYTQYEDWTSRIITEGNADSFIIFVIPERWKNSDKIENALKERHLNSKVIDSFDFLNAERKARAKVDIVVIDTRHNRLDKAHDAFSLWFDRTFKIKADICKESTYKSEASSKKDIKNELVQADNVAEQLVSFYQKDMNKLFNNYKSLEQLDYEILKELNVDINKLKDSLKERISGLKHLYWNMLFDRYNKITSRLTSFSKEKFLDKLHKNADIDFTLNNIFAVTLWIIKNSNNLFDEQLKHYYLDFANSENIKMYKSNKKFSDDAWRYIKKDVDSWDKKSTVKNFMYEYRLIRKGYSNYEDYGRLSDSAFNFVWDTIHIAENLGFNFNENVFIKDTWPKENCGIKNYILYYKDGSNFADLKFYQNGNIHIKFDQYFMMKFNIEASRILGWINDKEEASAEFEYSRADVERAWSSNAKIEFKQSVGLLEFKN